MERSNGSHLQKVGYILKGKTIYKEDLGHKKRKILQDFYFNFHFEFYVKILWWKSFFCE